MGRQGEGMHTGMAALVASCNGKPPERKEPRNTTPKWDTRTPTTTSLAQFDRDKSSRHIGAKLLQSQTGLFTLGPSNAKVEKANDRLLQPSTASKRHHNDGGDDRGRKSSKVSHRDQSLQECESEAKVPLKLAGSMARDKTWPGKARKAFIKKFYSPCTLATKSAKKRKVAEILEGLGGEPFPVSVTSLAPVLDSTGMKAGDQYLAEAEANAM